MAKETITANQKTRTTDTLGERGKWIKIGILPVYARPLTLLQVQEIGEEMNTIDTEGFEAYQTSSGYILHHPEQAKAINNAIIKSLFRKPWKRFLFGRYVLNHLNSEVFKEVFANLQASFDYDFFLAGLIFLQGTKTKKENQTETKKEEDGSTAETHLGGWSEA